MIKVYHGTNLSSAFDISIHGIDLNKSLPNLDFGKGFYTTDNKKKAIDRALKKTSDYNRRNHCSEEAYLVELLMDESMFATVYKGNIIKNLIMDCQSYTKYRPNETTGGIFVSWRRKEELPTGA